MEVVPCWRRRLTASEQPRRTAGSFQSDDPFVYCFLPWASPPVLLNAFMWERTSSNPRLEVRICALAFASVVGRTCVLSLVPTFTIARITQIMGSGGCQLTILQVEGKLLLQQGFRESLSLCVFSMPCEFQAARARVTQSEFGNRFGRTRDRYLKVVRIERFFTRHGLTGRGR